MKYKLSKSDWNLIGLKMNWIKSSQKDEDSGFFENEDQLQDKNDVYTYHINLNERGSFYADVRSPEGKTVFEIKAGSELGEGESSIFEDGFMKTKHDMDGLKRYLIDMDIMSKEDSLKDMNPNER